MTGVKREEKVVVNLSIGQGTTVQWSKELYFLINKK